MRDMVLRGARGGRRLSDRREPQNTYTFFLCQLRIFAVQNLFAVLIASPPGGRISRSR